MSAADQVAMDPLEALGQVMGSYRYDLTDFEAEVWRNIIDAVPADRFLAFLRHHYKTSPFPPKPADATKYLDESANPDVAYAKLEQLVRQLGPYQQPDLSDDPVLVTTILNMGGWVAVNEKMPAASQTFEVRAFRERFDGAFNHAVVLVRINKQLPVQPLLAIGQQAPALPAPDSAPALPAASRRALRFAEHATERAPRE